MPTPGEGRGGQGHRADSDKAAPRPHKCNKQAFGEVVAACRRYRWQEEAHVSRRWFGRRFGREPGRPCRRPAQPSPGAHGGRGRRGIGWGGGGWGNGDCHGGRVPALAVPTGGDGGAEGHKGGREGWSWVTKYLPGGSYGGVVSLLTTLWSWWAVYAWVVVWLHPVLSLFFLLVVVVVLVATEVALSPPSSLAAPPYLLALITDFAPL